MMMPIVAPILRDGVGVPCDRGAAGTAVIVAVAIVVVTRRALDAVGVISGVALDCVDCASRLEEVAAREDSLLLVEV